MTAPYQRQRYSVRPQRDAQIYREFQFVQQGIPWAQAIDLRDFGTGIGRGNDDSQAFAQALKAANTSTSAAVGTGFATATNALFIPPAPSGSYHLDTGLACTDLNCAIIGAGRESTRIEIASGQVFLTASGTLYQTTLKGLQFSGGLGVLHHTNTAVNVHGIVEIESNDFEGYTQCAIGSLASDFPYWHIRNNIFYGTESLTSIGIALSGNPDLSVIEANSFLCNLYHLKIVQAQNVKISYNDFIRFVTGSGAPQLTDLWIVPNSTYVNSGSGLVVHGNKFGNENLDVNDYRVLVADEGSGTNTFDKHHATTVSSGFLIGPTFDNYVAGITGQNKGFIYSYTPNLRTIKIDNEWASPLFPEVIQYDASVTFLKDRTYDTNVLKLDRVLDAPEQLFPEFSNESLVQYADDPLGLLSGTAGFIQTQKSGMDPTMTDLWTLASDGVSHLTIVNGTIGSPLTDSTGDRDAAELTFTADSTTALVSAPTADPTIGRTAWCEVEVMEGSSLPLTTVDVRIQDSSQNILMKRVVRIPSTWQRFRFPFVVRSYDTLISFVLKPGDYAAGAKTKVKIGRIRVYHATEPTDIGSRALQSLSAWTPGTIAATGGVATINVTVPGAILGDFAVASINISTGGLFITASVIAADTVAVSLYNPSASPVTPGAITVYVKVLKSVQFAY